MVVLVQYQYQHWFRYYRYSDRFVHLDWLVLLNFYSNTNKCCIHEKRSKSCHFRCKTTASFIANYWGPARERPLLLPKLNCNHFLFNETNSKWNGSTWSLKWTDEEEKQSMETSPADGLTSVNSCRCIWQRDSNSNNRGKEHLSFCRFFTAGPQTLTQKYHWKQTLSTQWKQVMCFVESGRTAKQHLSPVNSPVYTSCF